MTVIVALKNYDLGITLVGGDSVRSLGSIEVTLPVGLPKVYKTGGLVIGHTGAGRIRNITQALNIRFAKGYPKNGFNLERELIERLIPLFKEEARKRNFLSLDPEKLPNLGGEVMIAIGTQLCVIHSDFSVTPIEGLFHAIGSGQQIALGALEVAVNHTRLTPDEAVLAALMASSKFKPGVGPPFVFKKTKKIKGK